MLSDYCVTWTMLVTIDTFLKMYWKAVFHTGKDMGSEINFLGQIHLYYSIAIKCRHVT